MPKYPSQLTMVSCIPFKFHPKMGTMNHGVAVAWRSMPLETFVLSFGSLLSCCFSYESHAKILFPSVTSDNGSWSLLVAVAVALPNQSTINLRRFEIQDSGSMSVSWSTETAPASAMTTPQSAAMATATANGCINCPLPSVNHGATPHAAGNFCAVVWLIVVLLLC
jgi:hypothetical protein